ncbi:hypothetical protein AB3X94_37405 [Paraburkholderia sp. BR10923]|uniref:hypothetical protein n=1 Tax=Paraburkholderia sp. BR10923 TaxID=3236992 RepID=UPI0034CEA429
MTYNAFSARNKLVEKGLTAEQAETLIEVIQEHDEATGQGLATKADLTELKAEVLGAISQHVNRLYIAIFGQGLTLLVVIYGILKTMH